MDELRRRPDLHAVFGPLYPGRRRIRARQGREVWDILAFDELERFTANPHLILGIGRENVSATATLPSNARAARGRLIRLDEQGFHCMVDTLLENMRPLLSDCPGMEPRLRVWQRHWTARMSASLVDAAVDIDLRTRSGGNGVKRQPEWTDTVFGAFRNQNSNLELQIGAKFPYRTCEAIRQPDALDFVAAAWIACKPFLAALGVFPGTEPA